MTEPDVLVRESPGLEDEGTTDGGGGDDALGEHFGRVSEEEGSWEEKEGWWWKDERGIRIFWMRISKSRFQTPIITCTVSPAELRITTLFNASIID